MYWVKNVGTGVVTVDGNGAETVDTIAAYVLSQWESGMFLCDGSNWVVI